MKHIQAHNVGFMTESTKPIKEDMGPYTNPNESTAMITATKDARHMATNIVRTIEAQAEEAIGPNGSQAEVNQLVIRMWQVIMAKAQGELKFLGK